jgi:hypothetical protein
MEYTITKIQDYIEIIQSVYNLCHKNGKKSDLIFRGQSGDMPLIPKIGRLKVKNKLGDFVDTEGLIFREFKRTAYHLTEFNPKNDWDWLALAQHHGLPTRLLDWSYNALAALWFAVEKPCIKNNCGVVWILSGDVKDFEIDFDNYSPFSNKYTGNRTVYDKTMIFRPTIVTKRIIFQSGLFTIHKIENDTKIDISTDPDYNDKLTKIIIPKDYFPIIRKNLNVLGVNRYSIFHDIDACCKHLEWRFSYSDDEIPNSGLK